MPRYRLLAGVPHQRIIVDNSTDAQTVESVIDALKEHKVHLSTAPYTRAGGMRTKHLCLSFSESNSGRSSSDFTEVYMMLAVLACIPVSWVDEDMRVLIDRVKLMCDLYIAAKLSGRDLPDVEDFSLLIVFAA